MTTAASPATSALANEADLETLTVDRLRLRLKTGRNQPCPCGSLRKYKKCCLLRDETRLAQAHAAQRTAALDNEPAEHPTPPTPRPIAPRPPPRPIVLKFDALWDAFDALKHPTPAQMDEFLDTLLALPHEETQWSDPFNALAKHGHPDLPAVFHKITGAIAHSPAAPETRPAYFYWAAAEEFVKRRLTHLLPDIAAGFRTLDLHRYDADALAHLEDLLLAAGFDTETLALAEHFLPIERQAPGLMGYVIPERCKLIFELRIGLALSNPHAAAASFSAAPTAHSTEPRTAFPNTHGAADPLLLAQHLGRDLGNDVDPDLIRHSAAALCAPAPPLAWSAAHFELARTEIPNDDDAWQHCLNLYATLIHVAREAWQHDRTAPGRAFRGLSRLLGSVYLARTQPRKSPRAANKRQPSRPRATPTPPTLLDYLEPTGIDARTARSCQDLLGTNIPRAHLILDAHETLLRFALRHQLISVESAAATRAELSRLRTVLGISAQ